MAGGALVVELAAIGHGDDPGRGIDGEAAIGIVGQRIGDRGAGIGIGTQCGDADHSASGGVFSHGIGGSIAVADQHRIVVEVAFAQQNCHRRNISGSIKGFDRIGVAVWLHFEVVYPGLGSHLGQSDSAQCIDPEKAVDACVSASSSKAETSHTDCVLNRYGADQCANRLVLVIGELLTSSDDRRLDIN